MLKLYDMFEAYNFIENHKKETEIYLNNIKDINIFNTLFETDLLQDKIYIDISKDIINDIITQYNNYFQNKQTRLIVEDPWTYIIKPKNIKYPTIALNIEYYTFITSGNQSISNYIVDTDTIELNIMQETNNILKFSAFGIQLIKINKLQEIIAHELTHREDIYRKNTTNNNYLNRTKIQQLTNNKINNNTTLTSQQKADKIYVNKPEEVSAFIKQLIINTINHLTDAFNIRLQGYGPKIKSQEVFKTINDYINAIIKNKSLGNSNISYFINNLTDDNKQRVYKELFKYFNDIFIKQYPNIII